jgi:hypothetical protein
MAVAELDASRQRIADLVSGLGALVLGIGLGALLAQRLAGLAVPLLLAGLLVHSWGMYDKHRLERMTGAPELWWHRLLYWACWVLLALVLLAVAARMAGLY